MKRIVLWLSAPLLILTACNGNSGPKANSKDSVHKTAADSVTYNPSALPAQNSDDPNRFSQ